jgi:hypothetical protein
VLFLLRPLGCFRSDPLQLAVRHKWHFFEIRRATHETCAEIRALSSGDTVGGKMGIDGESTSTVFRTASTTSVIPSSFSTDICTTISHIHPQYRAPTYLYSLEALRGSPDGRLWPRDRAALEHLLRDAEDGPDGGQDFGTARPGVRPRRRGSAGGRGSERGGHCRRVFAPKQLQEPISLPNRFRHDKRRSGRVHNDRSY